MSIAWWCDDYGALTFILGVVFVVVALGSAIAELIAWVRTQLAAAKAAPMAAVETADSFDPIAVLQALKGVLEALKGLPAWIAIFLGGLALLGLTTQQPEECKKQETSVGAPSTTASAPNAVTTTTSTTTTTKSVPTPGTGK
ncbi:hypothetical protein E2493_20535 [Sphingomonas parva]|uniref:Uncharacterized protein n=1 Tax=Sphingomonas parva TaxID=2555898 RepID=A0A4Y8ZPH6_9SPHN|nr:hypothetical protein [Sphingomonas parva]TFI56356.1 hypothetical protein E2493_20535 [Sphingomonas parva]